MMKIYNMFDLGGKNYPESFNKGFRQGFWKGFCWALFLCLFVLFMSGCKSSEVVYLESGWDPVPWEADIPEPEFTNTNGIDILSVTNCTVTGTGQSIEFSTSSFSSAVIIEGVVEVASISVPYFTGSLTPTEVGRINLVKEVQLNRFLHLTAPALLLIYIGLNCLIAYRRKDGR